MRILAVSGASGGHIFPALSFLQRLNKDYPQIETLLALPSRSRVSVEGVPKVYLSALPLGLKPTKKNLFALLKFFQALLEGLKILSNFKPDIAVGFGSLDSLAVMLWAWVLRIPTLIHEQNVSPGRANRLLAKLCDKTAISFAQTARLLEINSQRIILTGNPIRQGLSIIDKQEALRFFGLEAGKFTVLIAGGSLGSHRINLSSLEALKGLAEKNQFQVIHLCGAQDLAFLKEAYLNLKIPVKLFAFLPQMDYAYCASDLIICRSGATTIAELTFFALPAILVPYPFAYQHQLSNARVLENMGSAIIIADSQLDAKAIAAALEGFFTSPGNLADMRRAYAAAQRFEADKLLVQAALSLN